MNKKRPAHRPTASHAARTRSETPEARVKTSMAKGEMMSRDTNRVFAEDATFGERVADGIVSFGGSWTFITIFAAALCGWICLNTFVLMMRGAAFDPYPYILLNLTLSTVAAFQAPIIMMSQNRQAAKDRLDAAHTYEINLKMELEVTQMHEKINAMREEQQRLLSALLDENQQPVTRRP